MSATSSAPAGLPSVAQARPASRLISIAGGSAGNVIEWFDFLAYSIFSIYFSKAFFPGGNMTVQLLNTAAIAAVGYVVRPLGSWLIGVLADRKGRRVALSLSVAMMSVGSMIIACTPTYATIGVAAPVVLVVARLLQGFSMGGEAGTSATYLSEMAPAGRRGFFVGFVQVTVVLGQLIALGLLLLLQFVFLTPAQLDAWGWRIPFAIGGVLALFALFLRRGIAETDAFTHSRAAREPLLKVLLRYRREVLLTIGISVGGTVSFYTFTIYLQKYMVNTAGFSRDRATLIATIGLVIYMFCQPLFGLLSDKIGRKPVMLIFGVGGTFLTVPTMLMSDRIAVMAQGRIEQIGSPADVYLHPSTPFVASFLGETNLLPGLCRGLDGSHVVVQFRDGSLGRARLPRIGRAPGSGSATQVSIRPERIRILGQAPPGDADSLIDGTLARCTFLGRHARCLVQAGGQQIIVSTTDWSEISAIEPGSVVRLAWRSDDAQCLAEAKETTTR
ncbi:MAG: MFS transporter [Acetobacteraceae bacterium]